MNIRKIVEEVFDDLSTNLNNHIASCQAYGESWYTPLTYSHDAPRIEEENGQGDSYFMGIYLSSPEGQVFSSNNKVQTVTIALDCVLDSYRENSNLPTYYLSAVIDYLQKKTYEISSTVTMAQIVRTDLDAPVNAFSVAINISAYVNDYDMDYNN